MGPQAGLRHARKHLSAYCDHAGALASEAGRALRLRLVTTEDAREARALLARAFDLAPLSEAA
jgi:hypothetical protein